MSNPTDCIGFEQRMLGDKTAHAVRDECDCAISVEWRDRERGSQGQRYQLQWWVR
jgi:hypothetical protein